VHSGSLRGEAAVLLRLQRGVVGAGDGAVDGGSGGRGGGHPCIVRLLGFRFEPRRQELYLQLQQLSLHEALKGAASTGRRKATARCQPPARWACDSCGRENDGGRTRCAAKVKGKGNKACAAPKPKPNQGFALPVTVAVASALAHLHRCGIAHRDLSPYNILLARLPSQGRGGGLRPEEVQLCDFGHAYAPPAAPLAAAKPGRGGGCGGGARALL